LNEKSDQFTLDNPSNLRLSSRLSFLFKDSLFYGGASVFNKFFSLFTFPVLTRHFTVAEYGTIDLFGMVTSFVVIFLMFGQDSALARFFYDSEDKRYRQQVVSKSLLSQLCMISVVLPFGIWFAGPIGSFLSDSPDSKTLVVLVLITAPFDLVFGNASGICKWTFKRWKYVTLTLGVPMLRVLFLLAAIFLFDIQMVSVFLINLLFGIIGCVLGIVFIKHWIVWPSRKDLLKPMLVYAAPMGVVCTISVFVPLLQRILVEDELGSDQLGEYSAGAKIAMLAAIPIVAFHTAWGPFSLSLHAASDSNKTYQIVIRLFILMVLACVLLLDCLSVPLLAILAGSEYSEGSAVVFPLALGLAVTAIGLITSLGLTIEKRESPRLYSYLLYIAVSVLAMWLLGKWFGMIGIAYGALLGEVALAAFLCFFSSRISRVDWQIGSIIPYLVLFLVLSLSVRWAGFQLEGFGGYFLRLSSIIFFILLGWFMMFDRQTRTDARTAVSAFLRTKFGWLNGE
jgi:O-antigen/teichoic acid export membrane protein